MRGPTVIVNCSFLNIRNLQLYPFNSKCALRRRAASLKQERPVALSLTSKMGVLKSVSNLIPYDL